MTAITPGQVYVACHPLDERRRIRITAYTPGVGRATVVDADTGLRPRGILVTSLHASATTRNGTPRQTGYAREGETT